MRRLLETRTDRVVATATALALAALLVAWIATFQGVRFDDAFISYRYGEQLARGHGFVFNEGSHVLGTTAPLHCVIAAGVHRLVGHERLPSWMSAIGCVGWIVQAAAAGLLVRRALGASGAAFVTLAIALGGAGSPVWVAMETNLVSAAVLVAFVLAGERRWIASAAAAGVGALLRPDAAIAGVLVVVACALDEGRRRTAARAVRPALVFGALFGAWIAFATAWSGSPIPQSAITKFHRASVAEYAAHLAKLVPETPFGPLPTAAIVLVWALVVAGAILLVRRDRALAPLVAWGALHAIAYLVLRPFTSHVWHAYPLVLVAFVCFAGALALLGEALVARARRASTRAVAVSLALVAGIGALVALGVFARGTIRFARAYPDDPGFGGRDAVYHALARHLRARSSPDDVVSSLEVGTLAYASDLPMSDRGGLVTRHPGRMLEAQARGAKTNLRWLVLQAIELPMYARYFGRRQGLRVVEKQFEVFVYDLAEPEPPP